MVRLPLVQDAFQDLPATSVSSSSGTGVPPGWFNVKDAAYGAKGDGTTDDSAAIQAAINACNSAGGGTVYFPAGTFVASGLSLDLRNGIALRGAGPVMQYQTGVTKLLFNGTSGHLLTMYSSTNCELRNIQFEYSSNSYTGDLIDIDGNPNAADCQNLLIWQCGSKGLAGQSARSIVRMNKVVIATIMLCHWTGAVNPLRIGDPGGSYVNVLNIEKCCFNFSPNAFILVGSADCESLTVRDCTFEAGTNTTAIRGATVAAGDAGNNLCYAPLIEGCWLGDAGAATVWIDSLNAHSTNGGTIIGNRFSTVVSTTGIHAKLAGTWAIMGNSMENGVIYDISLSPSLTCVGNTYANPTKVFSTDPNSASSLIAQINEPTAAGISNTGQMPLQLQFNTPNTNMVDDNSRDLIIGNSRGGLHTFTNASAVYHDFNNGNAVVQAPMTSGSAGSIGEVQLAAGASTPSPVVRCGPAKLGFYNTAPIVKPSAAGTATGYAAGATAGTFHTDDTYTGNVGTTAYTINGVVAALKNLGLLTA